ncbi:glycerol-3-phosphate dehydrogenase/oxidase [Paenibacillus thermotolerans]|uniref:glycerol-3-phosphate dehydrogenase/oxidase n=1 Tax=Paenibacillus thermotolerans TaxID=3027807 RepID=UPI002367DDE2|nr:MULTISPECIES: FAD-dependent oxidoreductase [unclassified Paenibacillus]
MKLSAKSRGERLQAAASKEWDVIVIGGGITGAGIAMDAALRGMSVALVEMQDFAAGTSSRSTKLIHGGLRYLKQFHVKMVAEVGRERAVVYENGPHVTKPERMLLPIYRGVGYGKLATSFAISVYDRLAGVKREERKEVFTAEETLRMVPFLKREGLLGGIRYVEYRTDDARLTLEVIKKANELGALPINYAKAEQFIYDGESVSGVVVRDQLSGEQVHIRGNVVINATGPWSDRVRKLEGKRPDGKKLLLTKGVHIVIDGSRLPLRQAVYCDMPDGRMVFVVPRDRKVYIGTTDTVYSGDTATPSMEEEDLEYLLAAARFIFPEAGLTRSDVESSWAGLRPLIHEEGKSPSQVSRKDEIWQSSSGLLTIAGGKLTGYRKMAEHIVDRAAELLRKRTGRSFPPSATRTVAISGGDVGGSRGFEAFVRKQSALLQAEGLSEEEAERLVRLYGSNAAVIQAELPRYKREAEKLGVPLFTAITALYGIEHEMMATPSDYFLRRVPMLLFGIRDYRRAKSDVLKLMQAALCWDEAAAQAFREQLEREEKRAAGV